MNSNIPNREVIEELREEYKHDTVVILDKINTLHTSLKP